MSKVKRNLSQYGSLFLCLVLIFALLPVKAAASETTAPSQTVRVGWYEDSYHITGENGMRSGYGYEYEQAVSAYTGWDYEYVKGSWEELLKMLQDGEIDLMGALSYTDERAKTMLFSDLPMGEEKYYLYVDLANTGISASDLSTLNDKPIAMLKNSVQTTQFCEWEEAHQVKTQHVFVESIEKTKELIETGSVAGVISTETPIWVEYGMSAIVTTGSSGIYYGISKKRPDLKEELDNAMRSMENDKPFYGDELYQRYLASQSVAVLSGEEEEWLSQHGVIRIGYLKNDAGFSMLDEKNGELTGVINDYIEYASSCFNGILKFETAGFDSAEEEIEAVKNGSIDMIFHVSQNPYYAEESGIALSNTVLSASLAAITSHDYFDENAENTVALVKGYSWFKWYVSYNYPNWKIREYDSLKKAEKAVRNGRADCLIARSGQTMSYVNDKELHSVFLTKAGNASFAVCKGNRILMSILNKTLKTMQTSKLAGAVSMYEDAMKKVTLIDFVKDNLLVVTTGFILVFFVILAVILALLGRAKQAARKSQKRKRARMN